MRSAQFNWYETWEGDLNLSLDNKSWTKIPRDVCPNEPQLVSVSSMINRLAYPQIASEIVKKLHVTSLQRSPMLLFKLDEPKKRLSNDGLLNL